MPRVGRKGSGDHEQSVVFAKAAGWTKASSKKWIIDHKRKADGYDENETQHRWRQVDPEPAKFRYRNNVIKRKDGKPSITQILGFLKGSKALAAFDRLKLEKGDLMEEEVHKVMNEKKEDRKMGMAKEMEKLRARVDQLAVELVAKNDLLEKVQAELATSQEALATLQKETAEKDKRVLETHEEATAKIAELEAKITEQTKIVEGLQEIEAERDAAKAETEKIKAALANPALVDAAMLGTDDEIPDGGQAADEDLNTGSKTPKYDEYMKLANDPVKQSEFWAANEEAIKKEMADSYKKV